MSFALDDVNNFVVGSEEGNVYTASRHGNKGGINDGYEGEFQNIPDSIIIIKPTV